MTTNASRAPVDLDALAADGAARPSPRPGAKPDPLAELARIVGQDDPFRALLEAQSGSLAGPRPAGPRHAGAARIEPAFETPAPQLRGSLEPDEAPADAFHRYLAEVEHEGAHGPAQETAHDASHGTAHDEAGDFAPVAERPRGRRRLVLVGAALGVCVVGVAGAMTWKGMGRPRGTDGAPLLVMADKAPLKVAPQDAGGVVIPDQNKQIYERNAKDGQIRIVNREEQPLDVNQVARAAAAAAPALVAAAPTAGAATAAASNALQDSLGEPRRVRTVSVRPEAPPFARDAQRAEEAKPVPAPPSMVLPDAVAGTTSAPLSTPRAVKPAQAAAAAPVVAPPATPARPVAVQRVAAATPDSLPDATASTAAATGGGFAVQLGVRGSDAEARTAFRQLQERFGADLAGRPALIRQADVNGKSIYRVRVGPMAREEANGLCAKLQGAGGQCFVAKN